MKPHIFFLYCILVEEGLEFILELNNYELPQKVKNLSTLKVAKTSFWCSVILPSSVLIFIFSDSEDITLLDSSSCHFKVY